MREIDREERLIDMRKINRDEELWIVMREMDWHR